MISKLTSKELRKFVIETVTSSIHNTQIKGPIDMQTKVNIRLLETSYKLFQIVGVNIFFV